MMIHLPFRLQSAHNLFSGLLRSSLRVFACLSVIALSCRDMIEAQYVNGMKASLLALVRVEIRRQTRAHHVYDTRRVQCTRTMPPQYLPLSLSSILLPASTFTMSAAARAEARKRAILSRGGDRLAKLTSSARGEDAPAFVHDGPWSYTFLIVILCMSRSSGIVSYRSSSRILSQQDRYRKVCW